MSYYFKESIHKYCISNMNNIYPKYASLIMIYGLERIHGIPEACIAIGYTIVIHVSLLIYSVMTLLALKILFYCIYLL